MEENRGEHVGGKSVNRSRRYGGGCVPVEILSLASVQSTGTLKYNLTVYVSYTFVFSLAPVASFSIEVKIYK